jgi:hypothetical protein
VNDGVSGGVSGAYGTGTMAGDDASVMMSVASVDSKRALNETMGRVWGWEDG